MPSSKNCTEFGLSLTAILLTISLAILSPDGLAQTQMVLVTTGSTMPEPLYVLWGDEYHKVHPETQVRYLAVCISESANPDLYTLSLHVALPAAACRIVREGSRSLPRGSKT